VHDLAIMDNGVGDIEPGGPVEDHGVVSVGIRNLAVSEFKKTCSHHMAQSQVHRRRNKIGKQK